MGNLCSRKAPENQDTNGPLWVVAPVSDKQPAAAEDQILVSKVESEPSCAPSTPTPTRAKADQRGRPSDQKQSRQGSIASTKSCLDSAASESLKKFAERNRPASGPPVRAMLSVKTDGGCVNQGGATRLSLPIGAPLGEDPLPRSHPLARYDIFDDVDEERLKEFEEVFEMVKNRSNYAEHMKWAKRMNTFVTCAGVTQNEETGMRVLS
mmetsp:Transcript_70633/g.132182  ORF Transcript_70633/g.132182 Transcript_70633/m.132182 type:complete len:209 (+) Transcript_70633:94-720(+)